MITIALVDLGTLRAEIEINTESAIKSVNNFKGQFDKELKNIQNGSGQELTKLAKNLGSIGSTMTKAITLPLAALGVACVKLASDMTETQNKVETVFGSLTSDVRDWASNSINNMGLAEQSALDMAASFGDMATSMGLSTGASADMSMNLVQLAADLSSFKNISVETANSALTGVFTGEGESLKRLGVIMNETTLSQYAMNQGIKTSYSEMTQAEKVELRYNYVMSQTSNAQGDFAKTGGSVANSSKKLKEQLKQLGTQFGSVLYPVISKVIGVINNLLNGLASMDSGTRTAIVVIAAVIAAIGPLMTTISGLITAIQAISAAMAVLNISTGGIITIIGVAVGAIAALIAIFGGASSKAEDTANSVDGIATSADEATAAVEETGEALDSLTTADATVDVTAETGMAKTTFNNFLQEVKDGTGEDYTFTFSINSDAVPVITSFADVLGASVENSRVLKAKVQDLKTAIEDYGQAQKNINNAEAMSSLLMLANQYNNNRITAEEYKAAVAEIQTNLDILNGTIDTSTQAGIKLANAINNGASMTEIAALAAEYAKTIYTGYSDSLNTSSEAVENLRAAQANSDGVTESTALAAAAASTAASLYNDEYNTALNDASKANTGLATAITAINTSEANQVTSVTATKDAIVSKCDAFNDYIANRQAGMTDEQNFAVLEKAYSADVLAALKTDLSNRNLQYMINNRMWSQAQTSFNVQRSQAETACTTQIEAIHASADVNRTTAKEAYYAEMNEIGSRFNQEDLATLASYYTSVGDTDKANWIKRIANWSSSAARLNTSNYNDFVSIGQNMIVGWNNGIDSQKESLIVKARQIANQIKKIMTGSFQIQSPSKWFKNMVGKNMILGWEQGISGEAPNLYKSLEKVTDNIKYGSISALRAATSATSANRERAIVSNSTANNNSVIQNNTFTSKELTPYEQRMELRKLNKDLAGVFA